MKKQKNDSPKNLKVYEGKLFNVVVTNSSAVSPERIGRLTDPEYQQREYRRVLAKIKTQYGNALEQLKYL